MYKMSEGMPLFDPRFKHRYYWYSDAVSEIVEKMLLVLFYVYMIIVDIVETMVLLRLNVETILDKIL